MHGKISEGGQIAIKAWTWKHCEGIYSKHCVLVILWLELVSSVWHYCDFCLTSESDLHASWHLQNYQKSNDVYLHLRQTKGIAIYNLQHDISINCLKSCQFQIVKSIVTSQKLTKSFLKFVFFFPYELGKLKSNG